MSGNHMNGHAAPAAAATAQGSGHDQRQIHQPRARRIMDPRLARAFHDEVTSSPLSPTSGVASGPGTPAPPEDVPLSVKATSAARKHVRRKTKQQRLSPSIEYEHRVSYFDPNSSYSNFRGFFVLFWIGLAIMILTTMLRNLKETNLPIATGITFLISALAHELIMGCITRKFRGYGFIMMMMMQMPLVMIQQTPFIRKRVLLNNIMFWISMILGLSL
ncbi:Putative membrane bound O-acyl transferase, MBOAT [Septoria linicola]|uniref:Membrane bound O-acyl transferase, MBOAT n=1 Tax=Septoria linicola TaxID=215465 RepID=A0A9Q9EFK1_9PEZI|nr:Putative membrane bound O-acyl transferase, MBOAT [Septoria linicola]